MTTQPLLIDLAAKAMGQLAGADALRSRKAAAARPNTAGVSGGAAQLTRFVLYFIEMSLPMTLGMILFGLVVRQLRTVPGLAATFGRGADLTIVVDGLFMSAPMVAWMVYRRHGWRHSLEMAAAMLAPMIAIVGLGWLGAYGALPWLPALACPASSFGMLAYMLLRREQFTSRADHTANGIHH